jgi:hypothetical protein
VGGSCSGALIALTKKILGKTDFIILKNSNEVRQLGLSKIGIILGMHMDGNLYHNMGDRLSVFTI